jgi:DNA replication initiation complex subunit (GINS family)
MALSYSSLREIQKKEMESAAAVKLEEKFYEQVAELLANKKGEAMRSQSIMAIKEYENIRKTVISIQAKREEKIILMALRGETEANTLTPGERGFLHRFAETVLDMRTAVKAPVGVVRKVKILKEVEQYIGLDKSVYGPFKSGEEKLLPRDEAEWLLKANMAEPI